MNARRKAARQRLTLDRDVIAAAALKLTDAQGLDALTMRALGSALGVEAMALYHYFPSKGALLDAVAEAQLAELDLPAPDRVPDPIERIRAGLWAYRDLALRHPHAFPLLTSRRFTTNRSLAVLERILEPFGALGVNDETMARLFRLCGYFVGGAGLAEIASRTQRPEPSPLVMEAIADGAHEAPPRVARAAAHLRADQLDGVFAFGVEAVLAAARAAAERARRGRDAE